MEAPLPGAREHLKQRFQATEYVILEQGDWLGILTQWSAEQHCYRPRRAF